LVILPLIQKDATLTLGVASFILAQLRPTVMQLNSQKHGMMALFCTILKEKNSVRKLGVRYNAAIKNACNSPTKMINCQHGNHGITTAIGPVSRDRCCLSFWLSLDGQNESDE
jgi:hypothetical protein